MKEIVMSSFGSWFREVREQNGYTVRGMAKILEVTPSYLSKVERDDFTPMTIEKLVIAGTTFNIPLSELLDKAGRCQYCGGFKPKEQK
jgi:transcriptional regulator with XRE-family HTH domain